jgi:hypothetical protein
MYRRRPVEAALPRERRVTRLKLNIFQRLTRQWDALHPYNAAQAMRIAGDVDDLEAATKLAQTLAELQVGWATLTGRHYVPSAPPGAGDVPLEIMPDGMSLDVHISNELNRPFAVDGGPTLRPFLVRDVGSYWLGVIYHHWAADSASIRALLREWFLRLYEPERARRTAFVPARLGYLRAVGPRSAGWDAVGGLLDAARWSSRFKSVRRLDRSLMDQIAGSGVATHFSRHELPDGLVRLLRAAAKQRDATLNDLFLAVLAYAVDKYVVEQPRFRRHALALGTIVDLRPRSATLKGLDAAEAFGLYLGFTNVVVRPQDLADIERLIARIAAQNRHNNRAKAPETGLLRMAAGVAAGTIMRGESLLEFYRKRLPLGGGISNVNMARTWVDDRHPELILDYVRASPAGPMLPLVITPTTLGNRLHFGMTCRESILGPADRAAVAELIRQQLLGLAAEQRKVPPP